MVLFKIGDNDYTSFMAQSGVGWEKNDLEDDSAGRALDGEMYRKIITKKRKLSLKCKRLTFSQLQPLATDLDKEYIDVTFLDPILGEITRTFYGTQISSTIWKVRDDSSYWEGTSFEIVEK